MTASIRRPSQRPRRHGPVLGPPPRRELERAGWRTTLDYRENHVRGLDGRLLRVEPVWTAEAERYAGQVELAKGTGATAEEAWDALHAAVVEDQTRTARGVSVTATQRAG